MQECANICGWVGSVPVAAWPGCWNASHSYDTCDENGSCWTWEFLCRLPTDPIRKAEHKGLNPKSANLNSALKVMWRPGYILSDRDIVVCLDADQAAFPDFLTSILPCMDAGVDADNVALVQSPQVSKLSFMLLCQARQCTSSPWVSVHLHRPWPICTSCYLWFVIYLEYWK